MRMVVHLEGQGFRGLCNIEPLCRVEFSKEEK
jgi:hypothetical protein